MSKCAAIQMASGPTVSSNLLEAEKLIAEAVKAGAKLVALPENFALVGNHETDKIKVKEVDGIGQIQDFLSATAKKHGVWIIGGTMPIATDDPNRVRAACLIYNELGERVARYDKVHLFDVSVPGTEDVYRESNSIGAGTQAVVIDSPFGRLGIAICYDLRFPEFFRNMMELGADVLIIPAAFTYETGAAHWEVLLRARAIENLCYVIAPNQGGVHANGRRTFGHSMIIDPWGVVLDCYKIGGGFACADLDPQRLQKVRKAFPVLTHQRFSCEKICNP
jgi:nitrilase